MFSLFGREQLCYRRVRLGSSNQTVFVQSPDGPGFLSSVQGIFVCGPGAAFLTMQKRSSSSHHSPAEARSPGRGGKELDFPFPMDFSEIMKKEK